MTASRLDASSACPEEKGRILLVLADPDEADRLATFLEFESFATLATDLGAIALALAAREEPDVIVIDLLMDDLSAFEVSRALKASPRTREIPRLLIADSEAAVNPVGASEAGFSDYLCRPFSPSELLQRIRDLLPMGEAVDRVPRPHSWLPKDLDRYRA